MATAVDKVAQEVLDAADTVLEEASEAVDAAREWSGRDVGLGITFGLGTGITIGALGGFWLLSKKLKTKYEQIAEAEIESMREHYLSRVRAIENQREKEKMDQLREEIVERQEDNDGEGKVAYHRMYQPDSEGADTEGSPEVVQNVFVNNGDDPEVVMEEAWDYDVELRSRSPQMPYVIHRDEYNNETPEGFEQYTLTYFEGDDVLCRDDDTILDDQDKAVGLANLARFGHGSGDPNIVYIRNHELKVDLEVVHSDGKYATEVAGFQDDELQHSSMRRRSPRRSDIDADR